MRALGVRAGAPADRVECGWRVEAAPGLALQLTFRSPLAYSYDAFCSAQPTADYSLALFNATEEMPDPRGELEVPTLCTAQYRTDLYSTVLMSTE